MNLPWLLQKENIARIEGNHILIGDRRLYPFERTFVTCKNVEEIAEALKAMVTQGGGPLQVALTTLRLISDSPLEEIKRSVAILSDARPINTTMRRTLASIVDNLEKYPLEERSNYLNRLIDSIEESYDSDYQAMGRFGSSLLRDGDIVLTTCFAEHTFTLSLLKAQEEGKRIKVMVPETRPYLQGSRLTAPSLAEVGIEVEVISDAMGAHFMERGEITHYMTACDVVAMDGTAANKVGSLANAIAANYYQIPYTIFALSPDTTLATGEGIVLEERDGSEILQVRGVATTLPTLKGRYPSFDKIEPKLITNIVTPRGIFAPSEVGEAYR
ncbi:MAG: translation initiation factor 2 [Spirochaetales bacterium]|nr:translation initiation factor 2 [Spirochaetales bacterium]